MPLLTDKLGEVYPLLTSPTGLPRPPKYLPPQPPTTLVRIHSPLFALLGRSWRALGRSGTLLTRSWTLLGALVRFQSGLLAPTWLPRAILDRFGLQKAAPGTLKIL